MPLTEEQTRLAVIIDTHVRESSLTVAVTQPC
jgi:hypothetical protein